MPDLELWYPAAIRDPAPAELWGTQADSGEPKFVLHTTEGPPGVYVPDARTGRDRRYYGNPGNWPNYTLARPVAGWRIFHHIPANRSSLSLRNLPGGVQTNRDNVTQCEIAWSAEEIGALPDEALDVLAQLLAWEHRVRGVPLVSTVAWPPYPSSYGSRAPQRLSGPSWDAYSGVLGHMHAPENDHGDPGAFPIGALLGRAKALVAGTAPNPPPEDDVTEQDKQDIADRVLELLRDQVFSVQPAIRQGDAGQVFGATYNKVGDLQAAVSRLAGDVATLLGAVAELSPEAAAAIARTHPVTTGAVLDALAATNDVAPLVEVLTASLARLVELVPALAPVSPSEGEAPS